MSLIDHALYYLVMGGLLMFGLALYLIPSMLASHRCHRRENWLIWLNILFGWTGIIWVSLLLWAALGKRRPH